MLEYKVHKWAVNRLKELAFLGRCLTCLQVSVLGTRGCSAAGNCSCPELGEGWGAGAVQLAIPLLSCSAHYFRDSPSSGTALEVDFMKPLIPSAAVQKVVDVARKRSFEEVKCCRSLQERWSNCLWQQGKTAHAGRWERPEVCVCVLEQEHPHWIRLRS